VLLVTLEYDGTEMEGPPFSVSEEEVMVSYENTHEVDLLVDYDALADSPGLTDKGVTSLREKVYHLRPRS
jgi:thiopurine S-methyltransferase